jgi:ornithine cyclodeaminase
MPSLPTVDEAALRAALSPADAVAAIRSAFAADGLGQTLVPPVINLPIPGTHGEFHVKTAWVQGMRCVAIKVASGFYDNPALGLPTGSGLMALFDAATGMPVALLFDNGFLTDLRTGAAGAVAADLLAARRSGRWASSGPASRRATRSPACAWCGPSRGSSRGASIGRGSRRTAPGCARRWASMPSLPTAPRPCAAKPTCS